MLFWLCILMLTIGIGHHVIKVPATLVHGNGYLHVYMHAHGSKVTKIDSALYMYIQSRGHACIVVCALQSSSIVIINCYVCR